MAKRFVQTPTGEAIDLRDNRYGRLWRRVRPGVPLHRSQVSQVLSAGAFGSSKLDPRLPARTISKMQGSGFAWMAHWSEQRSLTTFEAQVLTGFPRDFKFLGDFENRWGRIGNSVPPPPDARHRVAGG